MYNKLCQRLKKLHDINPFEWMKSVLEKIPAHQINKVADLLPHRWAAAQ
ncbi:hypothetical protein DCC81_11485 [Chitinophaga parva]|uniref:Transposase IS66 C-terminal domain-containing protein n=1 Tax=Chitinophaga parva TaxID=2169414 RepID=A0A2T7BFD5_9BACT|nr:hypothetical protein DCC81_11485 [Chitinophaga parva]